MNNLNPFEHKNYYQQLVSVDIGTAARELLNGRITDDQGTTIYVDCPHHQSISRRSFHISLDKQTWYCFGCGVGGDVLQLVEFVQSGKITKGQSGAMPDYHRQARDWLADIAGMPHLGSIGLTPEEIKKTEAARALTVRAYECLTETAKFYNKKLLEKPEVLEWLKKQYNFGTKIIEEFVIGYADNSGLIAHLLKAGFTLREMTASGAFRPDFSNDEIVYPVFENRVVFPYMSKGQTVFMIARKTPWTPDNKYEAGKYKKLPVYDVQKRRYIAEGIDNGTLYNEDILTGKPDYVVITEGITDCISLMHHDFPTISPVTVNINNHDIQRIISKCKSVKKVVICQDNEISQAGWKGALRSADRFSREKISCRIAQLPLGEEQELARHQLKKHNIFPGIDPKELKKIQEEKSLKEWKDIQQLIEKAKIDVCSFFVSGKTAQDFQNVIDNALLPVEFAIESISDDMSEADRIDIIKEILGSVGQQPNVEQGKLLKQLKEKTDEPLSSLRAGMKEAITEAHVQQRERIKQNMERELGIPVYKDGNRSFYIVDNAIVEQIIRETAEGPISSIRRISNFHIRITQEEVNDDGEPHADDSTAVSTTLVGEIVSKDWKKPFSIQGYEWGSNSRLANNISDQAGNQALFSTKDMDMIRLVSAVSYGPPKHMTVYSIFGVHPKKGFVTPSITISGGRIFTTVGTGASVKLGSDYGKAERLAIEEAANEEVKDIVSHILTDYVSLQPKDITLPILAHAFLGPLLFGMDLLGEFSPYILFLVGSSGMGKTETARLAQAIWGDFQVKEHMASWGSTPEINRQEAARCRGVLWTIDDFKRVKIGHSQWTNAIRVLSDYADLQARKRATPGSRVITGYPMKCMLLVTGEDVPAAETALLARSLLIEFKGKKDIATFRKCIQRQRDYRKIPAPYIAWLQTQDKEAWRDKTRGYLDSFASFIDSQGLNTDNSRRIASNAALSLVGLYAFLEFAQHIGAIDTDHAEILMLEHWGILCDILKKTLREVNETKPVEIFMRVLEELIQAKRVRILEYYDNGEKGAPIIGYYKDNRKYVCLLPTVTMSIVRDVFKRSEDEPLNFSTAAISKQLAEEGYIQRPSSGRNITSRERIPGAGEKTPPERVWKFYAEKIGGLDEYGSY